MPREMYVHTSLHDDPSTAVLLVISDDWQNWAWPVVNSTTTVAPVAGQFA